MRTLTTIIEVEGGSLPVCPVWTEKLEIADLLRSVKLKAPVVINQIVLDTGIYP
jgi:CxxC motif-containing protein